MRMCANLLGKSLVEGFFATVEALHPPVVGQFVRRSIGQYGGIG